MANELHELCAATPPGSDEPPPAGSTREVYADLARLLAMDADERRSRTSGIAWA